MALYQKKGNWYIDYYVDGYRKREKIGSSRKLAQIVLKKRKVEIAENRFLDRKKEMKVSFREIADTYLETYAKTKKSYRRYQVSMKHLLEAFGDKNLSEITPLEIQQYYTRRREIKKLATVNREMACLKHLYTKAIEWGKALESPAKRVKLDKENNKRVRYLTEEELDRLIRAAAPHLRPIVITAAHTGLRLSEILNLRWEDVDFKTCHISVLETKNGERREIPMSRTLTETLRNVTKAHDEHQLCGYVFCDGHGGRIKSIRTAFENARGRVGIKDFRFHDLRHTFASHLAMRGVDLNTIRELLGHKDMSMTLRYSHLSQTHKQTAVGVLDQMSISDGLNRHPDGHQAVNEKTETVITN